MFVTEPLNVIVNTDMAVGALADTEEGPGFDDDEKSPSDAPIIKLPNRQLRCMY